MSRESVECLRRAVELGNAGDLEALAELYHPDVELRDLQPPADIPSVIRGREAIVASWERWMEALGDWNVEVSDYVDADPWVICDMRWRATGRGSAAPIEWRLTEAYEVADGMIVRQIAGFPDVATALATVGTID